MTLVTHSEIIQVPLGSHKTNKKEDKKGEENKIITKVKFKRGRRIAKKK